MSSAHKALRGVRKTIAKQVKGRFACKFRFTLTYEYVDLQCTNKLKPSNVTVLWFRSHRSKTSKKPEVKACYLDPKTGFFMYNASWSPPNTVELVVTLYKDSTGNFKKKDYFFVIETHIPDADRKKLALFSCNMADFAAPDTNEFDLEMEFKPQSKKVVLAKLGAKIKCEFIKQGSAYDDDMESNFSHMSDTEFKQRINDLTECSDDEDDDKQNNYSKKQNTRQSWTKFVDEMKTLEYQEYHIAMVGNPLAESLESVPELPQNTDQKEAEQEQEDDAPSSPLPVTTSKTRVKKTRVLSALIEEEEKEEEEEGESPTSPLTEEKQTTQDEEIKFVFPDRKLTRAETLPDIHLAAGNGIIQESHRIKEWMNDVNYKKQEVVISDLKGENQELREGNKVLGNEILELHKEQDDLHTEINELQMLVEDLRTKVSELESKEKKTQTEKRKDNSKNDSSGTNTLPQNKKATQVRGWLCKRGVKGLTGRVWRRRWFATDQQRRLYYYKKTNNTQPRGFIDLDIIIAVQDKPSEEQDINNALFDVIVPGRVFELMAHDEEEKIRWINALDYLRHWRTRMINKEGFGNTSYDI